MTCFRKHFAAVAASTVHLVQAQQLKDGHPAFMSYPGISNACETALNTTVDCPAFLQKVSVKNAILDLDQVQALCTGSCVTDLQSARSDIASACTADTDVIVYDDVAYPATFIADQYLFTTEVSCLQDTHTGEYCDPKFLVWSNQSFMTRDQSCSDCWLNVQALQLGNPLGYDDSLASNFAELKASCNAKSYTYATPTAYGINATATTDTDGARFTKPSTCTGSYVLQPGDDCNSVAKKMGVSTYSMLVSNGLDLYCRNFDAALNSRASLCTPPTCKIYEWGFFDDCNDVASKNDISVAHFLSWNPNFDSICRNSIIFAGYEVCVSAPGGSIESGASANLSVSTGASSAVQAGDDCAKLSVAFSMTISDFLFLNPKIHTNCTNLLLGVSYCVFPVGDIGSYSGYQAAPTLSITVSPATFPSIDTAVPSAINYPDPDFVFQNLPKAPGTADDCTFYADYSENARDAGSNSCTAVASAWDIQFEDLLDWNPSLSTDQGTCAIQPGRSYCVQKSTTVLYAPTGDECLAVNATEIPEGTSADCTCFTEVSGYEGTVGLDCEAVADDSSITLVVLQDLNPWLATECDNALFAGLGEWDHRAVCIGTNATGPSSSTRPSLSGPRTTEAMGPTQSGMAAGCHQFYTVQSGDSCAAVEEKFDITFAQLYKWNPSIGEDCANLWLGYAYCVDGSISATTTSSPTGSTPSFVTPTPTQEGMTKSCNDFYKVKSGDGCYDIVSYYGISLEDFYTYNPAVGDDCSKLYPDNFVCVGVTSSGFCKIDVTFNTAYSTEWGESVWAVGSIPELGSWDVNKALMLTGSSGADGSTDWQATAELPADTQVSYKFVKMQTDGTPVWEQDPNRSFLTSSCGGSAIQEGGSWQGSSTGSTTPSTTCPIVPTCTSLDVVFEVLAQTTYGESVYVIGSVPALGEWSTNAAVALAADQYTQARPLWRGTISLAVGQDVQFKFIKINLDGTYTWEADPNRVVRVPTDCSATPTQSGAFQQ
ncbi:hypothetical protein D0869_08345 [Hortaea werneckii]|uniref:CBM20 domain-containing protein n=1 Tax=Hortaea werneckii TaxID=91943 RepID=A0A3M6WLP3_HORWE|nr:hypothetical protein D0869_08345 [Hortaea werneckii]RMY04496.1 hypothetical protein D0868_06922 [Hortaea werneckii]